MNQKTHAADHRMTTAGAAAVLLAWDCHAGEPGGLVVYDTPAGIKAHYTPNPGNIAGRMVLLQTADPLDPPDIRKPSHLARAINDALDKGGI